MEWKIIGEESLGNYLWKNMTRKFRRYFKTPKESEKMQK